MWKLLAVVLALVAVTPVDALARGRSSSGGSHSVRGYTKKSGTYVAPHIAKNPRR